MEDCYDDMPKKKILFFSLQEASVMQAENCKIGMRVKDTAIHVRPTQKITRPQRRKKSKPKSREIVKKSSSEVYDFIDH